MVDGVTPSGQGLAEPFELAGRGQSGSDAPGLTFDADDYLPLLGESDLSEDQARELLATLWQVMCGFVELGLRVDVCGELGLNALQVLSNGAASIDSGPIDTRR